MPKNRPQGWVEPQIHVVGGRIRARRQSQGLHIPRLAEAAQIGQLTLTNIENGKIPVPAADALYRIAVALNCSMEHLLDVPELPRHDEACENPLAKENRALRRAVTQIATTIRELGAEE